MHDDLFSVSSVWLQTFNQDKPKEMILSKKGKLNCLPNSMYEGKMIENVLEHDFILKPSIISIACRPLSFVY